MQLIFHGHACFEFSGGNEPTVLLDPYRPDALNGRFSLPPIEAQPDVIGLTHYHEDHAWVLDAWRDVPIADHSGDFGGITFVGVPGYHDRNLGTRMGLITMLRFQWGGLDIVHLGDLGVALTAQQQEILQSPDVLLLPVGGTYTLGPEEAHEAAQTLHPRWIVPMHGSHPQIDLPLRPVTDFLDVWQGNILSESTDRITLDKTPSEPTVIHFELSS